MIRLGFVGLGWWGRELARAAALLRPRLSAARCYSPVEEERRGFAREFGAEPSASLDTLLASSRTAGSYREPTLLLQLAHVVLKVSPACAYTGRSPASPGAMSATQASTSISRSVKSARRPT